MTEQKNTVRLPVQASKTYGGYRCYITREAWVITYQDADLIRVFRDTAHRPGFVLLLVKLIMLMLVGRRTELRDKWAIDQGMHEAEAHEMDMAARAARPEVLEFTVEMVRKP